MNIFVKNVIKNTKNYLFSRIDALSEIAKYLLSGSPDIFSRGNSTYELVEVIKATALDKRGVLDHIILILYTVASVINGIKSGLLDLFDLKATGNDITITFGNYGTNSISVDGFAIPIHSYVRIKDCKLKVSFEAEIQDREPDYTIIEGASVKIYYLGYKRFEGGFSSYNTNQIKQNLYDTVGPIDGNFVYGKRGILDFITDKYDPDELHVEVIKDERRIDPPISAGNNKYYAKFSFDRAEVKFDYDIAGFIGKLHDGNTFKPIFAFFSGWKDVTIS